MLIEESPGHLFIDHEMEDLSTFMYLAMLFGWDADFVPCAHYVWGELSHDGFLDLHSNSESTLDEFRALAEPVKKSGDLIS